MKDYKKLGAFTSETDYHKDSKLMQQLYEFCSAKQITLVDAMETALEVLKIMPEQHRTLFSNNAKQALKMIETVYGQMPTNERFLRSPQVSAKQLAAKLGMDVAEVEKSSTYQSLQNTRETIKPERFFSLAGGADEMVLLKSIQQMKTGLSSVALSAGKFMFANLTTAVQQSVVGSVGRCFVFCDHKHKQQIQAALDFVVKQHELSVECCTLGKPAAQVVAEIKAIKANGFAENGVQVVTDLPDLNQIAITGYTQAGVLVSKESQKMRVGHVLSQQVFPLTEDLAISIRTTAQVTIDSCKQFVSIMDITYPLHPDEQNQRSITSPYYTRTQPSVSLRDYYTMVVFGQPAAQTQQTQSPQGQGQSSESSDSSESTKEEKVDSHEILMRLGQQMQERMIKRLPNQKLLCDLQNTGDITRAYEDVEDLPKKVIASKNGIQPHDPMFLMINGRPVPVLPQFIHSVALTGDDMFQIKIKLIAPGQITGKKDYHQQITNFPEHVFLKEIVYETSSASLAEKVKKELVDYKAKGDKMITKQQQEQNVGMDIDPDFVIPQSIKNVITNTHEQPKVKSNYPPLDRNTLSAALLMRPKLKAKVSAGQTRKDFGELYLCENGLRYKLIPGAGPTVDFFIPYKLIRNFYYEKFTTANHTAVLCAQLWQHMRLADLLVEKKLANDFMVEKEQYDHISFSCSLESDTKLGTMNDREDALAEKQKLDTMKRASGFIDKFIENFKTATEQYSKETPGLEQYICKVCKHSKELKFEASVEQQGLQAVYSYTNGSLGAFNKKVCRAVNLSDIELAIFENVNVTSGNAFQIAMLFKDVRLEPFMLKQIQFNQMADIQAFLLKKGVFYYEISSNETWGAVRNNLNKDREVFSAFVSNGGWLDYLGVNKQQEATGSDQETGSVYEELDDSDESAVSSYVQSESHLEESGDEDDYYDWDRSE